MADNWMNALEALRSQLPGAEQPPQDDEPSAETDCSTDILPSKQPRLDILLDKKNRKGKAATIIAGFTCSDTHTAALATRLKQQLGTGGSARGGEILIQGDKRNEVARLLTKMGYKNRVI